MLNVAGIEAVVHDFISAGGRCCFRQDRGHLRDARKVDVWRPEKGNSISHGARPVHQIFTTIKWIRTGRLSIHNFLSVQPGQGQDSGFEVQGAGCWVGYSVWG